MGNCELIQGTAVGETNSDGGICVGELASWTLLLVSAVTKEGAVNIPGATVEIPVAGVDVPGRDGKASPSFSS